MESAVTEPLAPPTIDHPRRWLGEALPLLFFAICAGTATHSPAWYDRFLLAKDSQPGAAFVENATVAILLAAIAASLVVSKRHWRNFPHPVLGPLLLAWALGCIYFAGEEISWGQWIFRWGTPEVMQEWNRQEETNLHNTTSWLNEKPRALLEIWLLFAVLAVPLARHRGRFVHRKTDLREWINPAHLGMSCGIVFLISKGLVYAEAPLAQRLADSELRELFIAYFLLLWPLSVAAATNGGRRGKPPPAEPT